MKKLPLSVCIIAKNEEKYIEECLQRISRYGFEIIVTDTGSTDRTREIAQKYADKVLEFEWIDDFSAARNFCAQHATNDWIYSLDCDEYIESIDIDELARYMEHGSRRVGFVNEKILQYNGNGDMTDYMVELQRMYHRRHFCYHGLIHEQVYPTDGMPAEAEYRLPIEVTHYGYAISAEEMLLKEERNIRILNKALQSHPKDAYLYFQLGSSYYSIKDYAHTIEYTEQALDYLTDWKLPYVPYAIQTLARAYFKAGRVQDAVSLVTAHEADCPYAHYSYYEACLQYDAGEPLKSLFYALKAAAMKDFDRLGSGRQGVYRLIIDIYQQLGQEELALPYQQKYEELTKKQKKLN